MDYEPIDRTARVPEDDLLLQEALAIIGDRDFEWFDSNNTGDSKANAQAVAAPVLYPVVGADYTAQVSVLSFGGSDEDQALSFSTTPAQWPTNNKGQRPLVRTQTRRRCELAYLRGLVGDLEGQLNALRTASEEPETGNIQDEDESSRAVSTTLWKSVASSQHAQRLQAEQENAKLKLLLHDQIQVGKKLERLLLRTRPNAETLQLSESCVKRLHRTSLQTWDRSQIYDELVASCAQMYAETDRVMSRFDRTYQTPLRRNVELVHEPDYGIMLQTTEQRVFPFHYEETASELWGMFLNVSPHLCILDHDSVYDSDQESVTTKLQFSMKAQIAHSTGTFTVKAVKRRYMEAHRIVIVYSSCVEPSEVSDTKMDGISMRDKSWYVIEPLQTNPSRGSIMTVYYSSVPETDGDIPDQERKVGTLTNFLLSCISVELELHHLLLENRLIEKNLHQDQSVP